MLHFSHEDAVSGIRVSSLIILKELFLENENLEDFLKIAGYWFIVEKWKQGRSICIIYIFCFGLLLHLFLIVKKI